MDSAETVQLDPQRQEIARRYARIQRNLSFVELGLMALLLALLLFTGLSAGIRDWAEGFDGPRLLTVAIYGAVVGGGLFCSRFRLISIRAICCRGDMGW